MAKNALVKKFVARLKAMPPETVYPFMASLRGYLEVDSLQDQCGVKVVSYITEELYETEDKLFYLWWVIRKNAIDVCGKIMCSDTKRRKDFEKLGFKLVTKPFRNPNTARTIYLYMANMRDIC